MGSSKRVQSKFNTPAYRIALRSNSEGPVPPATPSPVRGQSRLPPLPVSSSFHSMLSSWTAARVALLMPLSLCASSNTAAANL